MTAGVVVEETSGSVVTAGAAEDVGAVEAAGAVVSPPRSAPNPWAKPPDGRSSNATNPAAAEVMTSAGSNRLRSDGDGRAVIGSPPRLLEVDVVGCEPRLPQAGATSPQQPFGAAQQGNALVEIRYRLGQHLSGERVFDGQRRRRADEGHQLAPKSLSHLAQFVDVDEIVVTAGAVQHDGFIAPVEPFEHRLHRSHADTADDEQDLPVLDR